MSNHISNEEIKKISVARWYEPFVSIFLIIVCFYFLYKTDISNTNLVVVTTLVLSFYMVILEIFKNTKSIIKENLQNRLETYGDFSDTHWLRLFKNVLINYLGVIFGILLMFFMYWFIPEYDELKYFIPVQESQFGISLCVLIFSLPMIFLSEYFLGNKKDGIFSLGLFFTLQFEKINWKIFRDGLLEWLVRLIFLTLNFTSAVKLLENYRENPLLFLSLDTAGAFMAIEAIFFVIILVAILPGYFFSWRLIGTENKKIDSTWFAWTFLLICYQPFVNDVFQTFKYVPQNLSVEGPIWAQIFQNFNLIIIFFGALIVFFAWIHLWAEAIIGIRSSNLTNRGIITNGPFRFTKHPVYLSKIFGWFLISLPFFNGTFFLESFQLGLAFIVVCIIFACRSLSEERLLATDPNYVKYALWMDEHATFAFVGKIFPPMTFKWRYEYWLKNNMLKN